MSDWVGKPGDHDPYSHQQGQEPDGGYVERRLCKLEFYQREVRSALHVLQEASPNGYVEPVCKACNGSISQDGLVGEIQFPICKECMATVGQITNARRITKLW